DHDHRTDLLQVLIPRRSRHQGNAAALPAAFFFAEQGFQRRESPLPPGGAQRCDMFTTTLCPLSPFGCSDRPSLLQETRAQQSLHSNSEGESHETPSLR